MLRRMCWQSGLGKALNGHRLSVDVLGACAHMEEAFAFDFLPRTDALEKSRLITRTAQKDRAIALFSCTPLSYLYYGT